jgi:antitoxin (DNA-binding transcriptional repressor) of toxin-antitoxin stability system
LQQYGSTGNHRPENYASNAYFQLCSCCGPPIRPCSRAVWLASLGPQAQGRLPGRRQFRQPPGGASGSRLIDEAHAGETIVLARAGKPRARLMPLAPPAPQRIPGRLRSRGPLSQPNVLPGPMDPSDLQSR